MHARLGTIICLALVVGEKLRGGLPESGIVIGGRNRMNS